MQTRDPLTAGARALANGDWNVAKESFETACREVESPEGLDGPGRALWWLKDVRAAIETRTRAYSAYRKANRNDDAAAVAVWLARELRTLLRNDAAADGWLARAETLSGEGSDTSDLEALKGSIEGFLRAFPDLRADVRVRQSSSR